MPPTTSRVPAVKTAAKDAYEAALATASPSGGQVQVAYWWPGGDTEREAVFLGRHPNSDESLVEADVEYKTLKGGRKQLEERFTFETSVWVFSPGEDADGAEATELRAYTLYDLCKDVYQDDPTLGLDIVQAGVVSHTSQIRPHERGISVELVFTVEAIVRIV